MRIQLVNNILTKIGLLSAMVLVTAVTSAQGQSLQNRMRANIPFDFSVAERQIQPGRYSIGRLTQNADDSILSIIDANGRSKAIRSSIPVQRPSSNNKGTLVFHRYGDRYFLFQVWPAGESTGRQFFKSRSEREIERSLAGGSLSKKTTEAPVETVTIVGVLQ